MSFSCDFLVPEPFDVNLGGCQVLEVFAIRGEQITGPSSPRHLRN